MMYPGGYLIALIHSLNNDKTLRYLARKPRRGRILARGPASVGAARGPKLNTKESSGEGLSAKDRPLAPLPAPRSPAPGAAFRSPCKHLFTVGEGAAGTRPGARPGGWASPIPALLAPPGFPGARPAGRGPEPGALPPRAPRAGPPASAPLTCRGVGDLPGHSRCESRRTRNATGRQRRAAGWAPGPRPAPGRLARPPSRGRPLSPAAVGSARAQGRAGGGGEAGCACPARGGAMLPYGRADGQLSAVTKGLGSPALRAELHHVFVWKG